MRKLMIYYKHPNKIVSDDQEKIEVYKQKLKSPEGPASLT
jgi:hypothetical protein